jgi:iron(III) transport system ATP-binding protein
MKDIKVSGIVKRFGRVTAVDHVSFEVRAGELLTLLGPSGCGKTTTLRIIAGLERADGGEVYLGDTLLSSAEKAIHLPPEKRGIGMVFQTYALWPHMTVFDNVAYPLRMKKFKRDEIRERVMAILDVIGLKGMAGRPAPLLSGGQQQRVALGRALVFDPDVLLLDEPLSNLDARLRDEMRFQIKEIQRRVGVTSIYVTHDQEEAMVLSDRVIVMNSGHIEQEGPPEDVFHSPRTRFTMDFLGQVNYIPARVTAADDGHCAVRVADAGNAEVALPTEQRFAEGDEVVLGVRPDDVRVCAADGGGPWRGGVVATAFLGSRIQYTIRMGACEIRALAPADQRVPAGSVVGLDISPRAMRVWPKD